jgi:hypothetical protein
LAEGSVNTGFVFASQIANFVEDGSWLSRKYEVTGGPNRGRPNVILVYPIMFGPVVSTADSIVILAMLMTT